MRDLELELKNRAIDNSKLLEYGFIKENSQFVLKKKIFDNQFEMIVNISTNKKTSRLIDLANEDEYIMADVEESNGEFVGRVREEYQKAIQDIIEKCTVSNIFKSKQTKEVIRYVKEKYNDELEFLWEKYDNNAIWRNKDNNKWYAVLLTVSERKLGIESDKIVEILDLKYQKESIQDIIDNKKVFPGYHMPKKSWITIKLDNTMDNDEIFDFIDNSYKLNIGNKKKEHNCKKGE